MVDRLIDSGPAKHFPRDRAATADVALLSVGITVPSLQSLYGQERATVPAFLRSERESVQPWEVFSTFASA